MELRQHTAQTEQNWRDY